MTRRSLSLTHEHVARATRPVAEFEFPPGFRPASDDQFAEQVATLMEERPPGPLRIFAYGSLIWNPGFVPAAQRRAVARGWHRQFCMVIRGFRGTPEAPGLMMALMSGGRCTGLALEVADGEEAATLDVLVRREMPFVETLGDRRWVRLDADGGPITALTFWAGPTGPNIVRGLPLAEAAALIARACGPRGSSAEYLHNTVHALEAAGIRDRNLWTLQQLVAEEIDRF